MERIRSLIPAARIVVWGAVVVIAFWNMGSFVQKVAGLPARHEVVVQEERYHRIQDKLNELGYRKGPIEFFTNRDLKGQQELGEDRKQRAEGQYVMVPWILLHNRIGLDDTPYRGDVPFAIGNFFDGVPPEFPRDLTPILDSGQKMILFKTNSQP